MLKIPEKKFKYLTLFSCLLPLLGTRTDTRVTLFQYVYFFPVYLIGMYAAVDYAKFLLLIKNHIKALSVIAVSSSVFLFYSYLESYNPHIGIINIRESLFYLQKISLCFLAIIFMLKLENTKNKLLWMSATYSFSIYFTHTLIGNTVVNNLYYSYVFTNFPESVLPLSIIYVLVVFFITLLFCIVTKKIIGKKSRFFIGT